jgi:hypothetical protein
MPMRGMRTHQSTAISLGIRTSPNFLSQAFWVCESSGFQKQSPNWAYIDYYPKVRVPKNFEFRSTRTNQRTQPRFQLITEVITRGRERRILGSAIEPSVTRSRGGGTGATRRRCRAPMRAVRRCGRLPDGGVVWGGERDRWGMAEAGSEEPSVTGVWICDGVEGKSLGEREPRWVCSMVWAARIHASTTSLVVGIRGRGECWRCGFEEATIDGGCSATCCG